jgi:hypothetical protein
LGCLHERHTIDGVLGEFRSVFVESGNFLLNIVYEKVSEALAVTSLEASKLRVEQLLVENVNETNTLPSGGLRVRRANACFPC